MKTNLMDHIPLTPGTCEWCGKDCEMEDIACSLSCEAQLNRLDAAQGKIILRVLKRWRKHRGRKGTPGEGAMSEVAQITDRFLRIDRQRRERYAIERRQKAAAEKESPVGICPQTEKPCEQGCGLGRVCKILPRETPGP